MSKILFLDIDGTLVDYEGLLPASAASAVRAARRAGHQVFLCTGRARAEVQQELWDLGVDGLIGGNGNYIEHDGEVVFLNALSQDDTRALRGWFGKRGLEFYLESNAGLFASPGFSAAALPVVARYSARKGMVAPTSVTEVFHGMVLDGELDRDDVLKISYILNSPADHLACAAEFPAFQHGTWGGRGAEALFGDVSRPGVTKAVAVTTLLAHLGASRDDTIAFGDAVVDLPMFEASGLAVAMGNAPDEVRAVADLVTDDVDHDGLANAFRTLGLA